VLEQRQVMHQQLWALIPLLPPCLTPPPRPSAPSTALQLVDEAYQRWLTEEDGVVDDVTAIVVAFKQAPAAAATASAAGSSSSGNRAPSKGASGGGATRNSLGGAGGA